MMKKNDEKMKKKMKLSENTNHGQCVEGEKPVRTHIMPMDAKIVMCYTL
ncbi:MAG: hypothetical protein IKY43_07580 [Bacteroidales bacterium]|nr:hypothetical protein [Bacteroidales bacterium]